jgi:FMN reductase
VTASIPTARWRALLIAGSPTSSSRSAVLLDAAGAALREQGALVDRLVLRELPAHALLHARGEDAALREASARVAEADVVVLATPLYKAAYSGLLKCFLDLLPRDALAGKWMWSLATGGVAGHQLAIDHALRPVLDSLGARQFLRTVFATDAQVALDAGTVAVELLTRLRVAVAELGPQSVASNPLPGPWLHAAVPADAMHAARCSA